MTAVPSYTPESAEQHARAFLAAGEPEKAEPLLRALLASGTGPVRWWKFLVLCLRQQKRFLEAAEIQGMLVDKLPGDFSLRFDLAETLLMLGEFDRGWREYHYRYSLPHTVRIERKVQMNRWDGRPIPNQTLLIHDEQGFGDTFQFLRLMPHVKARSQAKVVLEISTEALSFAQRMEGIDQIITRGTLPPPFQIHCEMMSLPRALGLKMSDLPGPIPYLKPDPARVDYWRLKLKDYPRPLVALVWGGRPTPDPKRSIPLATLAPLAMKGVTFLSLQIGPMAAEAKTPPAGMNLVDLSAEIASFDDTAAILSIADLLISIDSAPVHLAGALGRPAWVLLQYVADWRWFSDREDSPWYPTLRLFRQPKRGDWEGAVTRVAQELRTLFKL